MATQELNNFKKINHDLFLKNGLKEAILDSYKFTNLKLFLSSETKNNSTDDVVTPETTKNIPTIVFKNGKLESSDKLPEGVEVKSLKDHFQEVSQYLDNETAFANLHHSHMNDGLIIEVKEKTEVLKPIRILNLLTSSGVFAPTHFIFSKALSKVTIIEENHGSKNDQTLLNETYIFAEKGSSVEHICLNQLGPNGTYHGSTKAQAKRDATVKSLIFHSEGKLTRSNLTLNLTETNANGETYSLFLTEGEEHSDINTVIHHLSPDSTSAQISKGILDGNSKGVFTGKIHIHPKSQRVSSSQINRNLLLSNKAQIHSQPQLEIFADDVKCSHGSTTGQLSSDELFYFEARGIPADKARTLLALGFGLEVVLKITNITAKDHVQNLIRKTLSEKFKLGVI